MICKVLIISNLMFFETLNNDYSSPSRITQRKPRTIVRGFFLARPQACLEGQGKKKAQRAASARGLSERTISPDAQVRARCTATCAILVGCPQACLEGQGVKK